MRKVAILFVALATPVFTGCGSGVTVQGEPPIDIPEKIEGGGVTIQAPEEFTAGDVKIDPEEGRVTAQ